MGKATRQHADRARLRAIYTCRSGWERGGAKNGLRSAIPVGNWIRECAEQAVTIFKDTSGTLPVTRARYDSVRIHVLGEDTTSEGSLVKLLAAEFRTRGFACEIAADEDTKTAIRYLGARAKELHIDPQRVALWGDSSGGHTAVMVGITGDDELDADADSPVSCGVRCIVDWYGPTDISKMNERPSVQDHRAADSPEGFFIGRRNVLEHPELVAPTVPMNHLRADRPTPPLLIMHGDCDQLVPFDQSCRLYEKMRALGKEVEMYKLLGAHHAFAGFLCDEALDLVLDFLARHLS